jgi:lysophospholipid acyltransferase (LPLAT)-like uncharacterized protein
VATPSQPSTGEPRARRIEKPRTLKWRHHIAAFSVFAFLRLLSWTWRFRLVDPQGVLKRVNGPVLFCLWHNRLALSMRAWERLGKARIPCAGLVALISASHDGGVLARTLKYFNVEAARGSSSRRGAQALLELTRWVERDYTVAITPDGPRGPRYEIHDGIIALAQLSGRPILPVSSFVNWKFCLKSWDRFQVPLPFARCEMRVGELVSVPRDASDEMRARLKEELKARMQALTQD